MCVRAYLATPLYSEAPLEKELLLRRRAARYASLDMHCILSCSCLYNSSCINCSHRELSFTLVRYELALLAAKYSTETTDKETTDKERCMTLNSELTGKLSLQFEDSEPQYLSAARS